MKGMGKAIIAGVVVIVLGVAVILVGLGINDWKLEDDKNFEMKRYLCESEINTIKLKFEVGVLKTQFYDGDRIQVEYPETSRLKSTFSEKDGVLIATANVSKYWINFWNFTSRIPTTVISIPKNSVVNLDLEVDAGTVTVADGQYGNIKVKLNAGTLNFGKTDCDEIICKINAGTLRADSISSPKLNCKLSAGTVNLHDIACNSIEVDVSAGTANLHVKGKKAEYNIYTDVSAGSCSVGSQSGTNPDKRINVNVSAGTANINFD